MSDDWQYANEDLMHTRRTLDATRGPTLAEFRKQPQTQAKLIAIEKTEKELDALRDDRSVSRQAITAAAKRLLAMRQELSAAEAEALAKNEKIDSAKQDMREAADEVRNFWKENLRTVRNHPSWRQAKMELAAAEDRAHAARVQLERERVDQARSDRQRMLAVANLDGKRNRDERSRANFRVRDRE